MFPFFYFDERTEHIFLNIVWFLEKNEDNLQKVEEHLNFVHKSESGGNRLYCFHLPVRRLLRDR